MQHSTQSLSPTNIILYFTSSEECFLTNYLVGWHEHSIFPALWFCFFCFRPEERLCLLAFFSYIDRFNKIYYLSPHIPCFNTSESFSFTTTTLKAEWHHEALHPSPTTIPCTVICSLLRGINTRVAQRLE